MSTTTARPRTWQWIGALGIVYAVLDFIGSLALTGNEPSEGASASKVMNYYNGHKALTVAAVFVIAIGMVVFAFFVGAVRRALAASEGDASHLSLVVICGAAVYIGGFLVGALFRLALLDASHYHQADAALTLNYLSQDDWVPVVTGLSIVALGVGIVGLRSHALPKWLSWVSVGLGIVAVAGPAGGIAFLLTPLWALALGIVLALGGRDRSTASSSAPLAVGVG